VLVIAGDLTNFGQPEEAEPLVSALLRLRVPVIVVLGNHDFESGREAEIARMMSREGIKVLDGSAYERDGVGFAGTKGFVGGFGRGLLTAFGEAEIKTFVRVGIDEALKLERAMSQLRTAKRIVVLHYSPIAATVVGEAPEIYPFLGTSRLAEVVDRHGADLVLHGTLTMGNLTDEPRRAFPSIMWQSRFCNHNSHLRRTDCSTCNAAFHNGDHGGDILQAEMSSLFRALSPSIRGSSVVLD
jgi:predicted phosphohydrolase